MTKYNDVDKLPWHPIGELKNPTHGNRELLLMAPELVDGDCNVNGIGLGYWQDRLGHDDPTDGCFLACKWSMQNDEWYETEINPTHFIVLA